MAEYTKVNYTVKPNKDDFPSPTLVYHKWHAYDSIAGLKHEESRLDFLKLIADLVKSANRNRYPNWYRNYCDSIEALGDTQLDQNYETNWRLIAGWGVNPALETGIYLHHFYGFPYIPGSTVKGLLHHVAELGIVNEDWNPELIEKKNLEDIKPKLEYAIKQAELVRILFGSIFIKKHVPPGNGNLRVGLQTPLEWFEQWHNTLKPKEREYKELCDKLKNLLSVDHTGGMLTFFDAVPAQDSFNGDAILQTDILNPHYQEYYQDTKNEVPPSDDQNPNPVYFLAVRPGLKFVFPYRIADFPVGEGRDDEEIERAKVLNNFTSQQIKFMVSNWLQKALTEWGAGAKTAAGYGYFLFPEQQKQATTRIDSELATKNIDDYSEIIAIEPQPFKSNIRSDTKLSGISKQYNQEIWKKISQSAYIKKIEGMDLTGRSLDFTLPYFIFEKKENQIRVIYKHNNLYCTVIITLQGIQCKEEAKYVWEQDIKPELEIQN